MKTSRILLLSGLLVAIGAHAEDEGKSGGAGRKFQEGGKAVVGRVEDGASAANKGVAKGYDSANENVFKKADAWIQSKVNKKGASAPNNGGNK